MSFDLVGLRAVVAAHGPVVRVVVAAVQGSAPREVGAAMLVWADGQHGTIGGGALEFAAAARARRIGGPVLERLPLGPALGQCCGGAVSLLYEPWDQAALDRISGDVVARSVAGAPMPLAVRRILAVARGGGRGCRAHILQMAGWWNR